MANESFSFSMNLSPGRPADGDPTRYLARPFEARPIHDGQVLLMAHGETGPRHLPIQLAHLLSCCDALRTLDQQSHHAARLMRVPPHQVAGLKPQLKELAQQGLLLSETRLWEQLRPASGPDQRGAPIETLFVRTCARPKTLERLLESLASQRDSAGLERCIVIDDAREQADQQATRRVVEAMRPRLEVELRLFDRNERARFLDGLARDSGADRDALEWFVHGDEADGVLTYGAGQNLALLLSAGTRMAMMDDDATLEGIVPDGCADRPVFAPQRQDRLIFPAAGEDLPYRNTTRLQGNPLALHADYLSASTCELLGRDAEQAPEALEALTPNLFHELAGQPTVKLTSSGVVGDPGTQDPQWIFADLPDNLRPLCDEEERYRERVFQRRVCRCPERGLVTTAFALMTTTLTGVDNRELLLPTASRERNEDMLLGALVAYLYPHTLQATLPHALYHMRPEPRGWRAEDLDRPRSPNRGRFLTAWLEELGQQAASRDTEARIALLEAGLRDLAARDEESLRAALARDHMAVLSGMIGKVQETRSALRPPEWMDRDFRRILAANSQPSEDAPAQIDRIAASTKRFAERYGPAIQDWCRAWRHCRETGVERLLEATR